MITSRRQLERIVRVYIDQLAATTAGEVRRHDRLAGLIHEYYRATA